MKKNESTKIQNFYHNGFELIEYVILQMYGGYPINDDILENCFHVYDEEMRKKILKAIVHEMKKINEFLVSEEYNSYQNSIYKKIYIKHHITMIIIF